MSAVKSPEGFATGSGSVTYPFRLVRNGQELGVLNIPMPAPGSALEEEYGLIQDDELHLDGYPTLRVCSDLTVV
jgi:hypothetical protein